MRKLGKILLIIYNSDLAIQATYLVQSIGLHAHCLFNGTRGDIMTYSRNTLNNGTCSSPAKEVRALRALSTCTEAVMSAKDEVELLPLICRIIVEEADYRLAWFGLAQYNTELTVMPVASSGYEEGYLETIKISWGDNRQGHGPTGTAIRTGSPCIAQNLLTDPSFEPWRAEAIKRGYASSVALPVELNGEPYGALNVYAAEPNAFDNEELMLLGRLASNLTYGLEVIRTRQERERVEGRLQLVMDRALFYVDLMSHDMSNHLQSILMSAEILRMDPRITDLADLLDIILESSDASLSIISKVRTLSSLMDTHPERVSLDDVLQRSIDSFRALYNDVTIEVNCKVTEAATLADEFVEHAFLNILENAVRYNPRRNKRVWVELQDQSDGFEVVIGDNGIGLSEDEKAALLDPARRYGGLGLHQARHIMENYGGKIEVCDRVTNSPSLGTEIRLWFPKSSTLSRST